ncbi:cytochrome c oxidase assembly protein COX18, mitochondrial-like [Ylistrum balloti]|uniref:cytochrome c oxidase assembly protein COX18, mitochondrial-like n=1 Tax=Ylistrum balloti TaxID=509963 RepID=UPI00290580EE|nr:cytochrome c oxidase assembly protein COX18, mitochondrial-like [Ylistrum balloti]
MIPRLNKLAHSSCCRTISANVNNIYQTKTHPAICTHRTALLVQPGSHSYSTISGVSRLDRSYSLSDEPTEKYRQLNATILPKHTLLHTCGRHILTHQKSSPWLPCGVGLGVTGSSRGFTAYVSHIFYKLAGIVIESEPVGASRQFFIGLHDIIGMPWWLTIISGTLMFRMTLLPLAVIIIKSQAKHASVLPEIHARATDIHSNILAHGLYHHMKPFTMKRETASQIRQMKREMYVKHNCSPIKPFLNVYVQVPVIVSFGVALRSCTGRFGPIADHYFQPEMICEGISWISNLTVADPYCIIPTVSCFTSLFALEYSMLLRKVNHNQMNFGVVVAPETKMQKFLNYVTRFGQLVVITVYPFLCFAPSALTLYICTTSLWSATQLLSLNTPAVRRALSITKSRLDSPTPHRDVFKLFKTKYFSFAKKSK